MKKVLLGIISVFLIITITCAIYLQYGHTTKKNNLYAYLENKGYSEDEIYEVKINHSFFHRFTDYPEWWATVEFEDEQGIVYEYYFNTRRGIAQGSFSGDGIVYGIMDFDELIETLKHLER